MRELSASELLKTHRKARKMTSKLGWSPCSGKSMAETYVLVMRCPVYRQRDSLSGFRTELENLVGDGNGKGTNGKTVRLKVRMRQPGADYSVVAMKQGNSCGAKGVGHSRRDPLGSTGNGRTLGVSAEGGSLQWVARAV